MSPDASLDDFLYSYSQYSGRSMSKVIFPVIALALLFLVTVLVVRRSRNKSKPQRVIK
jgi:hypothetical protein